ncbi:MAG: amino acid ABC transporter permease [Alphaproteobacteria bacterium]|nr:amino acid ABC transporter permease [Alphaproteobacteria bacterium]
MAALRRPPRIRVPGPIQWMHENLFSSAFNSVLTLVAAFLIYQTVVPFVQWAFIDAAWSGNSRDACLTFEDGACWPFIIERSGQIVYGFYDVAERWRVDVVFIILGLGLAWLTVPGTPGKIYVGALMVAVFPIVAFVLLVGGFGLVHVPIEKWGGLLITLVVAVTGIVVSLPLGIVLALGRRSDLPVVKGLCVAFIELWRGVPLITVLFMSANMLPLFMPDGMTINKLLSALIAVALFSSAYMAEVVRGGLQAISKGQYEAAAAVGLGYWRSMAFVILPQALRLSLPNIVGNFIGLLKDTSLVSIIGFYDLLGIVQAGNADAEWATPNTAMTGYVFAGALFWVMCFSMSRYAKALEDNLQAGERR